MIFIFGGARGQNVFYLTYPKMTYKIMKKWEKKFFFLKIDAKIELPMPFLPRIDTSYGQYGKKYFLGPKSASQ